MRISGFFFVCKRGAHHGGGALRTAFARDSRSECHQQWCLVADQLREKYPKIAMLMDGCENEGLAHMAFKAHWQQLHSTNPDGAVERRDQTSP
nr:transposase [Pseudomonas asplenii]